MRFKSIVKSKGQNTPAPKILITLDKVGLFNFNDSNLFLTNILCLNNCLFYNHYKYHDFLHYRVALG